MKKILVLIFSLLMTACATTKPTAPQLNEVKPIENINHWKISGSLFIRNTKNAETANYVWLQNDQNYQIQLSGPLGAGATQITGTPQNIHLQLSNGKTFDASNPEELLSQHIGWDLPVTNLVYWIRGLSAPGLSSQPEYDANQQLSQLTQQDWTIHYLRYTSVKGNHLPQFITLTRGDLFIKILVREWVF